MSVRQLRTRLNRISNRDKLYRFYIMASQYGRENRVNAFDYKALAFEASLRLWPPEPKKTRPTDEDNYLKRLGIIKNPENDDDEEGC